MQYIILLSVLFLAACGQTGPLYMPGQKQPTHEQRDYGSF